MPARTPADFAAPRVVADTRLDTDFTDLERGPDGLAVARLADPARGGAGAVELWVDGGFSHLMVYTGDNVAQPDRRRHAVAVEPMTCPPNALRTGDDLVVLAPGQTWQAHWGIRPLLG